MARAGRWSPNREKWGSLLSETRTANRYRAHLTPRRRDLPTTFEVLDSLLNVEQGVLERNIRGYLESKPVEDKERALQIILDYREWVGQHPYAERNKFPDYPYLQENKITNCIRFTPRQQICVIPGREGDVIRDNVNNAEIDIATDLGQRKLAILVEYHTWQHLHPGEIVNTSNCLLYQRMKRDILLRYRTVKPTRTFRG